MPSKLEMLREQQDTTLPAQGELAPVSAKSSSHLDMSSNTRQMYRVSLYISIHLSENVGVSSKSFELHTISTIR